MILESFKFFYLAVTVPHRHIVFSIHKLIRCCFLFDRKVLADLSRIARETLKEYMAATDIAMPG